MGFPAASDSAMSVRAHGRQTSQPPAACAAAARRAVRPRRSRISFVAIPARRSFATCRLVATISIPPAALTLGDVEALALQLA